MYVQADVLSFALSVVEDVETQDPIRYREAIKSMSLLSGLVL